MKEPKVLLEKEYCGFESASDIERDVSEAIEKLTGEFSGTIKVVVTYEEDL